ncbi:MAG TPA: prepilin-type N-terminal cleavage/methylation domain-containing protein [Phycisphaerae bacterium]|nr:prepilin-type N-terminal cleavage/methylation domain-containing protein [Phycisphaerae bacterium]
MSSHSSSAVSRRRSGRPSRAFTLIEMISTIVISSIVCGSACMLLWNAARQRSEIAARAELVDEGAAALEILVRYFRDITQNECPVNPTPCLNGNAQVTSATSTQVRWGNFGVRQSGSELQMTSDNGANWRTLCADLSSVQMTFFNRLGQDLQTQTAPGNGPTYMRRIVVTLTLSRAGQTVDLRTGTYLRNFMNEVTSDP